MTEPTLSWFLAAKHCWEAETASTDPGMVRITGPLCSCSWPDFPDADWPDWEGMCSVCGMEDSFQLELDLTDSQVSVQFLSEALLTAVPTLSVLQASLDAAEVWAAAVEELA